MSNKFKISTARLTELIKEEYAFLLAESRRQTLHVRGAAEKTDLQQEEADDNLPDEGPEEENQGIKLGVKETPLDSIRSLITQEIAKL